MFRTLKKYRLPILAVVVLVILLLLFSGSWLIARKIIALLILPAGAIWLALLGLAFWPKISKGPRVILGLVWILYSLAGSPYAGIAMLRPLESPYYPFADLKEDLDVLVVLGGATVRAPGGEPALGTHGDRVMRPVIWYQWGKVKTLIATGRSVTEKGDDRLLSKEASDLWQSLGVPGSDIIEISEPRNTSEELAAVAELFTEHPEWKTVGLCSSASHLNRALAEAKYHQLEFIPVPSDFRSMALPLTPLYLIPQARGFRDVQTACWEFLGALL